MCELCAGRQRLEQRKGYSSTSLGPYHHEQRLRPICFLRLFRFWWRLPQADIRHCQRCHRTEKFISERSGLRESIVEFYPGHFTKSVFGIEPRHVKPEQEAAGVAFSPGEFFQRLIVGGKIRGFKMVNAINSISQD